METQFTAQHQDSYLTYHRKSTDDADNQKNSIEYQEQQIEAFMKREGLRVANVSIPGFCENGSIVEHNSGFKETAKFTIQDDGTVLHKVSRPKFLHLMKVLQSKLVKGVVVLCWDRISRNEADDSLIKKLIAQGVDVRFVQASYDTSSAGKLHMDIDGIFSRHYSRVISEKVKGARQKLFNEGRCLYEAPIGYLDQGSDNKPFDPDRAELVRRMFELYATGEWSYTSLAKWANQEGLTTKPRRRNRTKDEKAMNLDIASIPKTSQPITRKVIEAVLSNPFYIGKVIEKGEMKTSTAHEPLISNKLFCDVQEMITKKTTTKHHPHQRFYLYRKMIKCNECGRLYSPYVKKGIIFYTSKCKEGCKNQTRNFNEAQINSMVQEVLSRIHFTDEELKSIEQNAKYELNKIISRRNKELGDLHRKQKKLLADHDYLLQERLTLLRTHVMTAQEMANETKRIQLELAKINASIEAYVESTEAVMEHVLTFSELLQKTSYYFNHALDSEKHSIVVKVFSELKICNGKLTFVAIPAFQKLLDRFNDEKWLSGSPEWFFSELENIYALVKKVCFKTLLS